MQSKATTIEEYLAELPEDRREAIKAVRAVILKNLPKGYEEIVQSGAIGYVVPHSVYPPGYHCDPSQPLPFVGLASQKNYMAIYLMCIYADPQHEARFREEWVKTGKRLDMGKSCVRFKKLEDVPLKVIGQAIKRVPVKKLITFYESTRNAASKPSARKRNATPSGVKSVRKSSKKRAGSESTKAASKRRD